MLFGKFNLLIFVLSCSLMGFTTQKNEERDKLLTTLDSLELMIQDARRSGEDIQSIMDQSDSLRIAIDNHAEYDNESSEIIDSSASKKQPINLRKKLTLPSSLIDWMIVAVGAIAVLAALLLVALHLIRNFHRKKQTKRVLAQPMPTKKRVAQPEQNRVDEPKEEIVVYNEPPLATYTRQGTMKTAERTLAPTENISMSTEPKEPDINSVQSLIAELIAKKEALEQQVHEIEEIEQFPQSEEIPTDFSSEVQSYDNLYDGLEDIMAELDSEIQSSIEESAQAPIDVAQPSEPIIEEVKPRTVSTRESILELAESGLTASEIARKLSMSVGEVQLILTMARRA